MIFSLPTVMPETIESTLGNLSPDEQERHLSDFLIFLRELYDRSDMDVTQQEGANKILLHELSPVSLRNLLFVLRETHRRLLRRCITDPQNWTQARAEETYHAIAERKLSTAISSRWHDHVLSTPGHAIQYQRYGGFLIKQELLRLAAEKTLHPTSLQNIGWISFDVNGLKTLIDCTNHQNGCHFLQNIAKILLDHKSDAVTPLTAGGDEFALLLKSPSPLSQELLTEIIQRYQQEIATNPALQSAINFEDPNVLMRYGGVEKDQRKLLVKLPLDEQKKDLQSIRDELPPVFTPSISGGAATLAEGILFALEREGETHLSLDTELETLDTIAKKVTFGMWAVADARQHTAKQNFKTDLEHRDPRLADFLRRNKENRELALRLRMKREKIQELLGELTKLQNPEK